MTQKEKINSLKDTIKFLYEKEGRSKSYIAKLLYVDRKILSNLMNEWGLKQANKSYLTPSNQKFANKNKQLIKSRLDNNVSISEIAKELNVNRHYLSNIIDKTECLAIAKKDYFNRISNSSKELKENLMDKSSRIYDYTELPNERWKEILGYPNYYISDYGRVKKLAEKYNSYYLLRTSKNPKNGREYIKINKKGLQISRLVGFAFVNGYSKTNNTIDHIDKNVSNNYYKNLQWVSQSTNNKLAYDRGRKKVKGYSKNGHFKSIVLDDKYEFKTIVAFAKFLNISETQAQRYINNECNFNEHKISFIY